MASLAVSGVSGGAPEEPIPTLPIRMSKERSTMQTVITQCGDARTFLTYFVGGSLDDDHYVIKYLS